MDVEDFSSQVIDHAGLVRHIAWNIHREAGWQGSWRTEFEDVVQEGWCGLLKAARTFDPTRGVPFGAFAGFLISTTILDYIRNRAPMIRLPRARRAQLAEADRVRAQLRQQLGHEPSAEHVAEALGITLEHLHTFETFRGVRVPLEEIQQPGGGSTPENEATSREQQERQLSLLQDLEACVHRLPDDLRMIVILREREALTLQEVAQVMGMHKDAVARRQQRARAMVRACLMGHGWTVADAVEEA